MDYNQIFYKYILEQMLKIDTPLDRISSDVSFLVAFPLIGTYNHDYERERARNERAVLRLGGIEEKYVVMLSEKKDDKHVIVYRDALNYLYDDKLALKVLVNLLKKFYTVEIQDRYKELSVDISGSTRANPFYLHDIK